MADTNDPVDAPDAAMERLEAALERIERGARPQTVAPTIVAARLDRLITQVRNALAEATG